MSVAKRPSSGFKNKTNINPSLDRSTEATAEDFQEAASIFEDHATILDQLTGGGISAAFYGFYTNIDILAASHPDAPEGSFAIIDSGSGNPQVAKVVTGVWKVTATKAPFVYCNTIFDRPNVGQSGVWYIVKDSMTPYIWHDGRYHNLLKQEKLRTDLSFNLDDLNVLRSNISVYSQTFIKKNSQVFQLDFEPTNIILVHGKVSLFDGDFAFTPPNTLEIFPEMAEGEKIRIVYEHFISQL